MKVGIIGCGLIGKKRAANLGAAELILCADKKEEQAQALAALYPTCRAVTRWETIIADLQVDIVIVATPHVYLPQITTAAVSAGKHVLVEKPAACRATALTPIIKQAETQGVYVRVGFNHRYHPAIQKAKAFVNEGHLGELMFIRGRYGHGGRLGYEKEWRANPNISGGGELMDQGTHVIDLARWFLGDFVSVDGYAHTYYWNMPVDDNGFLLLKTRKNQVAFLHVSCTEWKNTFSFEIYGKKAKCEINGLGGSYGIERLSFYKMLPEMGPPETTHWEYPMPDQSWQIEFNEFMSDIQQRRCPNPGLHDAQATLRIIEKINEKVSHDYYTQPA